ncbi:MAG: SDR family oxidoreductase [Gammaproteobacteria bacterium]|nr:SDR family oxidoreductase [Gammaproteobacteria bacterium]
MSVVVVTGANSGFGLAATLAFARNGDQVYATIRDPSRAGSLTEAASNSDLDIQIEQLDVTRPETFPAFVADITAAAGRVDVLVNNAGILRAGAFEDISENTLRLVMETNLFGPLLLTRAVLPTMRAQQAGLIIMISSLSGIAGLPGDVAYSASKYALEGATEALRHEVDRWGIRLALVEAGMYATGIFAASLPDDAVLPVDYPADSPYRPLIEYRLRALRARMPEAFDPSQVGELLVEIAQSDEARLRWPADAVAERVLGTLFAHDDAGRDEFLRMVSDTDWWSAGRDAP